MSKIPSHLNPPDNPEMLTDLVLYEWSSLGLHQTDVHNWACAGEEIAEGLTERVDYLLEVLDNLGDLHPDIKQWRSMALMTINCINGGSVPRRVP